MFSTIECTSGLECGIGTWLLGQAHFFYPPGNPLRSSGDLLRQESGFESPQDQEELFPNLSFPEPMALSLKHGLVRLGRGQDGRGETSWQPGMVVRLR